MASNGSKRPMDRLDGQIVRGGDEHAKWEAAHEEGECGPPPRIRFTVQDALDLNQRIEASRSLGER